MQRTAETIGRVDAKICVAGWALLSLIEQAGQKRFEPAMRKGGTHHRL